MSWGFYGRLADVEGWSFEKLVGALYEERSRKSLGDFRLTSRVQGFWDRGDTEIDLVALDETDQVVRFESCKRSPERLLSDLSGPGSRPTTMGRSIETITMTPISRAPTGGMAAASARDHRGRARALFLRLARTAAGVATLLAASSLVPARVAQAVERAPADAYLEHFTAADVRAATGTVQAENLRWSISEWKARPGAVVALSYHPVAADADPKAADPRVAILESRLGKLVKTANGPVVLGETHCENTSGAPFEEDELPAFALDLAPYRLSAGESAVGVRLTCHNGFPSGEGSETRLYLLESQGSSLRQVLDEPIAWTNHDRVAGEDTEATAVVLVQREKRDSHFDLVIRTKVSSRPFEGRGRAKKRSESQRLEWSGDQYRRRKP